MIYRYTNWLKEVSKFVKTVFKKQNYLPGLTEDETRYFQWLLCRKFNQTTEQQWLDLTKLNQKILKAMS